MFTRTASPGAAAAPRPAPHLAQRIRTLAVAVTVAAATLGVASGPALASDADPGVRCAARTGPGHYEFYLPGERVTDKDGNKWVCGPDGMSFRDYSASLQAPTPAPVPSPVVRAPVTSVLASTALR